MIERPQIYDERIMQYARDKTNYGEVEKPNFSSKRSNVACGDSLAISGIIKDGIIADIKFTGSGCMISQASAAMLLEKIKNQSVDFAQRLTLDDIKKMLNIELGFLRSQCAELPLIILHEALKNIKKNNA